MCDGDTYTFDDGEKNENEIEEIEVVTPMLLDMLGNDNKCEGDTSMVNDGEKRKKRRGR